MKKNLLLIISLLFFSVATKAQNPNPKELLEKKWGGLSEQNAGFTRSGKIQLSHTLNMTLNADNSVTGTGITKMTMDGVSYYNTTNVTGTFYPATWTVYIKDDNLVRADKLPYDLRWCKGSGTLKFYRNATHPGYYLLKGNVTDDCGGNSLIELTDYPNAY